MYGKIVSGGIQPPSHDDYFASGRYYTGMVLGTGSVGTLAVTADRLYAVPFVVSTTTAFDRIAARVTVGASVTRLGLYRDNGSVYPGELVHGTDELDSNVTDKIEETIAVTLEPGLYWLVFLSDGTPTVRASSNMSRIMGWDIDNGTGGATYRYLLVTFSYAALPSTFPALAVPTSAAAPIVALRAV